MSSGEGPAPAEAVPSAEPPAAGSGASPRQPRRGPAPFASFDHDVSDESSPESKLTFQLPEIREDAVSPGGASLSAAESRARSHSTPAVHGAGDGGGSTGSAAAAAGLRAPNTPRIDISRASSSSHQDSRDSSPDMAFPSEMAFREEGALDLRSSTEELSFLEGAPGQPPPIVDHPLAPTTSVTAPSSRRHSRKDSQTSENALLGVCGRSSRLSSVGSQTSALSALSKFSGISRSPSPHRMMLETSFCGPRPIDNESEICEKKLLEIARLSSELRRVSAPAPLGITVTSNQGVKPKESTITASISGSKIRTEVTLEPATVRPAVEKQHKECSNKATVDRQRVRNRQAGNIIRIRLKPDSEYDDDDFEEVELTEMPSSGPSKPVTLPLRAATASPARTPSPSVVATPHRKSSFCSLFRSSPESPASASRRKKSLTEGRPRSTSRDRSSGVRGSLLSLFSRTPRRSAGTSPPPPTMTTPVHVPRPILRPPSRKEKLKYYEDNPTGIIHIPLRTPDSEEPDLSTEAGSSGDASKGAPYAKPGPAPAAVRTPLIRTVLPDGSIIIPLHSPTEKTFDPDIIEVCSSPVEEAETPPPLPTPATTAASPPPQTSHPTQVQATIETPRLHEEVSKRSKQHVVFSTQVGGGGQVFSTQLSVTKTPSLSSELSVDFAPTEPAPGSTAQPEQQSALADPAAVTAAVSSPPPATAAPPPDPMSPQAGPSRHSAQLGEDALAFELAVPTGDSSESEASSDVTARRDGEETEQRGLVMAQESFDDDLPYVPTTLPMERSLALPMVPVRERGGVAVAGVQRPRPPAPAPLALPPPGTPPPLPAREKLRIKLPGAAVRSRPRADWIDFEDVPERRKHPKRIQTLPPERATAATDVVYVAPEHCRCECHHRPTQSPHSSSSAECGSEECSGGGAAAAAASTRVELRVQIAQPFVTDLDVRHNSAGTPEERARHH